MAVPCDNNISCRLCLITGASGGVGRAVAKDLYAQGCGLALTYLNNEEGIEGLVSELDSLWLSLHPPRRALSSTALTAAVAEVSDEGVGALSLGSGPTKSPPKISIHQADVSSPKDLTRVMSELSDYHGKQGPDMLVSCASFHPSDRPKILDELDAVIRTADEDHPSSASPADPAAEQHEPDDLSTLETEIDAGADEWKETMSVNLRSNFILARLVLPHMLSRKWGRIVFITGGEHESIHYQASKAGLAGFMRHLSNRVVSDGVTVNSVSPVFIRETGMLPKDLTETQLREFERMIPAGRLGTPDEVANVVGMFLRTGFMTGQSVVLAGGIRYVG
ncbi:3-oxoacyl-[acyl-carrier-protein] reductase FabG [Zalerion maritima]|uniref:3-oxoacyl-[acyl-carrier-protein] reductase FabG n=1 Tax=Zalerion maritima TaxID=339359 RepID=A0AAD5RST4_9PEZI|nr:3-oxoacyl-[acyl-carrier-protein] reductase FabG [Zalerion maritima]